jgi:hypothetical protein
VVVHKLPEQQILVVVVVVMVVLLLVRLVDRVLLFSVTYINK